MEVINEAFIHREKSPPDRGFETGLAHLVASAKVATAGAISTENTKLIEDLVGRAPVTTRQFVEDFKAAFN
jgi:hypothetical protein